MSLFGTQEESVPLTGGAITPAQEPSEGGSSPISDILSKLGVDESKLESSLFSEENFREGTPMYHLMMLAKSLK